jgi:uncharacterized protein (TIGR01615 family)
MPGLATKKTGLKARSSCSKLVARAKDERGLGALLSQIRVSPAKKGRRPSDVQAVTRSNLAMNMRMKLLGEGGETSTEDVSTELEPSSVRLAAMVDEFLEDDVNDRKRGRLRFDDEPLDEGSKSFELAAVLHRHADSMPERIVSAEVKNAINAGKSVRDGDLKRHVMRHLRLAGFNAGLCKSRWDHSGGFPGGEYEYIDVKFEGPTGKTDRMFIDIDFKAQFEIARPTAAYDALVQVLPQIFVGRADQLQWIVNVMSEAVKLSLKKRGMHLPPWRKPEYMRAKWFSSHIRTTNEDESSEHLYDSPVVRSPDVGLELQKPSEKPFAKIATGNSPSSFIDNNDWHLPVLKAKKSHGPGHAGLASLFQKPVATVK